METSPQDQETEAPSAISGTEIDFRRHVGTSQNFEEGNGASSGTGALTVSAHDTSIGAKYKLRSPAELPVSRSPCNLTVPHGLSPTSFLESPILLSNIKAEPSPTTGTFSLSELMQGSSEATAVSLARNGSTISALDQAKSNSFEFQFDTGDTAATGPPVSMYRESRTYIGIATEEELVVVYQRLERLLFEMRNSKRLTMSVETFEASRGFFERVPVFQNLTCLNIVGDFFGNPAEGILEFMQKMPNLECLCTFMAIDEYDYGEEMGPVPSCLMDKLKKIKVSGLRTATTEMDLIKIFLENACNLEEVLLCADKWNAETLETFKNELVKLCRSSEKCAFVSEIVPIDTVLSPRLYLERCIPEC